MWKDGGYLMEALFIAIAVWVGIKIGRFQERNYRMYLEELEKNKH